MNRLIITLSLVIVFFSALHAQSSKSREHYLSEVKYYSQKIKEEPGNISNFFLRGTFYHVLTDFSASKADFIKVIEIYHANPHKKFARIATDACYFLADDYYFRHSDRVNAQHYIDMGLEITPGDKRFEVLKTGILGSNPQKEAEAMRKFEELKKKYPDDEKINLYYAKFLERKDLTKSIALYENVILINPDNIDALFALGAYYANESARIFNATGNVLNTLDYMKRGVAYFEKIHFLRPYDKEIMEILIQYYGHLELNDKALQMKRKLGK